MPSKKHGGGKSPGGDRGTRRRPGAEAGSSDNGLKKFGHDYSKDYSDPTWPYARGKMDKGAWLLITATPVILATLITFFYVRDSYREAVRQPMPTPRIVADNATSAALDPERFWGTYRSLAYFGMKTRSPQSPVSGLMWFFQSAGDMPPKIRHWCDQGDGLPMYSWFVHDGVNFGLQEIVDSHFTLTTDFMKRPGGDHGGDWSARIIVKPRPQVSSGIVSLFYYFALDGQGHIEPELTKKQLTGIRGETEELGKFYMKFPQSKENLLKSHYLVTYADSLDQLKETMMHGFVINNYSKKEKGQYLALRGRAMPRDKADKGPNFIVYQVVVNMPYTMEVVFESGSVADRQTELSGQVYQNEINLRIGEYEKKFEEVFKLSEKGYSEEKIGYAKAALSNMLGSIGYFYGSSLVSSAYTDRGPLEYFKRPLYTGVPSRPFFPRGFLWDEGFHNLLITKWDQKISQDIIGHWFDTMNAEGWIPREQILGVEARAKVPAEFVIQNNEVGNPPTFFLPLQSIVKNLIKSDKPEDKLYLQNLFPRLKAWYDWFYNSQQGPKPTSFRWRGRDPNTKRELNPKTLSSGFDDYPRPSNPTNDEYHVDLRCWMALASEVMTDIAKSLGQPWEEYAKRHKLLTDNALLDELHWSERYQMYNDYGYHSDQVKLKRPQVKEGSPPGPPPEKYRIEIEPPRYRHLSSFGYVSLFPFLLKIVEPSSPKLGKILSNLKDPNLLWTPYGLRSLARNAPLYNKYNTEHDPPYWRGAVWINVNYLAVRALHHYSSIDGPYKNEAKDLYIELRDNVINNIINQWKASGYIWENYDDSTGKGKGCHPFTGWTALFVNMMAEEY